MSKSSTLSDFDSFTSALEKTNLPGTKDRQLLEDIYGLAKRRVYLETEAPQEVKAAAKKYEPTIQPWRSVLKILDTAQKNLKKALHSCEKRRPDRFYWKKLFHPAEESLSDLSFAIQQTQIRALAHLPPRFLKRQERWKWRPLLCERDSDPYPLRRMGWKPAETWFVGALDELVSSYFQQKKFTLVHRHRLIQTIFRASFNETKELNAIKVAISRSRKQKGK